MKPAIAIALMAFSGATLVAQATGTLSVDGTSNIFGAGIAAPPGGGSSPPSISFPASPGKIITFPNISGEISFCSPPCPTGPDGVNVLSTNFNAQGGISALIDEPGPIAFLVGVFLTDSAPAPPAPPPLMNFSGHEGDAHFHPDIGQTFFVGDGLTGTGSGQLQKFHVPPTATRLFLGFSDGSAGHGDPMFYQDNSGEMSVQYRIASDECEIDPRDVTLSNSGTTILAEFRPSSGLASAAAQCGFTGFNWVQTVTVDPYPPYDINGNTPSPPYPDPPAGGYYRKPDTANPFYWNQVELSSGDCEFAGAFFPIRTAVTLRFCDTPAEPSLIPPQFLAFQTKLVGVRADRTPQDVGFDFVWISDFNGTVLGGSTRKNVNPVDPNSGMGGIRIVSINGIQQMPPNLTCTATPNTLWPPNNKSVLVSVSGKVSAGTAPLLLEGSAYAVFDEYNEVSPAGDIHPGPSGDYAVRFELRAARKGTDKDGRSYRIVVGATDALGNVGSCSTIVAVPHDLGR